MDPLERIVRGVPLVLGSLLAVFYVVFFGPFSLFVLAGVVGGLWGAMERRPWLLAAGAFLLFVVAWVPFQSMAPAQLFVATSFLLAARVLGSFPKPFRYGRYVVGAVALAGGAAIGILDAVGAQMAGHTLQFVAYHALWALALILFGIVAVVPLSRGD